MKQVKLFEGVRYQTPLTVGLLLSFLGLYVGALMSRPLLIFLTVTATVVLCALWQRYYIRVHGALEGSDGFCHRLTVIFAGLGALSLFSFTVRSLWGREFSRPLFATSFLSLLFLAWMWQGILLWQSMENGKDEKKRWFSTLRENLPIVLLLAALFLLSIETFDSWYRWDSYDYYYYFCNLDYSTLDFFDNLRPANHAAYAVSAIYLVIDGLVGATGISLIFMNMLMVMLGTLAFWRILCRILPHWNRWTAALGAALFGFSPFLLGLQWSVGLETYLIFGLVIYLWAQVEDVPLLQAGAALLICFSKETGAVLLCAMIAARLLLNLLRKDGRGKPLLEKLELHTSLPVLCIGIFWLADFLGNSWTSSNNSKMATDGSEVAFNCFGFNSVYVKDRLLSLLFTNLTWVILAVTLVGLTVGILRKRISLFSDRFYLLIQASVGFLASLVPLFFFVTYNHVRYAGPTVILLLPVLVIALDLLFEGVRGRTICCGALALWLFLQSFVTVDPMMHLFFEQADKGHGSVSLTANSLLPNNAKEKTLSVRGQYNREMMYFDEAFDELLREIGYDDRTLLVISDNMREPSVGSFVYAEYLITGFGYPYMDNARYMSWDGELGARYLSPNPNHQMRILFASNEARIKATMRFYDRCVYIALPFLSETEHQRVMLGYRATEIGVASVGGWELVAYELTK